jgi:hypothetical protein
MQMAAGMPDAAGARDAGTMGRRDDVLMCWMLWH